MLDNCYNIGLSALQNAQVSVDNASNNIANADTPGYQKTSVVQETSGSITINGLTVGTGADVIAIESDKDQFVEAQYLDAAADLATQNAAYEYQYQLDSLFNQTDESGLSSILNSYDNSWNELVTDPDSLAGREELLGSTESLVYGLNSTAEELDTIEATIKTEIQSEVDEANQLIDDIALLNAQITANPNDNAAISERDQLIRDLNNIIGVETINQENGQVTILTEEGNALVDGTQTHHLVYGNQQATESLLRDSTYSGEIEFSGSSNEEILLEFVTTGPDGTALFKVSLDGGNTWEEDENGNTMLYTASDETNSVEVAGVEIWFEDGAGDHSQGDRYTIIPKNGLYWESSSGSLVNISPMTDASGQPVDGRIDSGSIAGLYLALDDTVIPAQNDLDAMAEALIWETNVAHSQGAGLEHHSALTGSYGVDASSAMLSNSGLAFEDYIQAGDLQIVTYDSNGDVSTSGIISINPATDSLDDVVAAINAAFGGELTASVNSDGQLQLDGTGDMTFEIASDSSSLMAACGVNTYFTGTDASTIAMDSYAAQNPSHINSGVVNSDGSVSSGNNDTASTMATLTSQTVLVGGVSSAIDEALATLVSEVGSATQATELKQAYSATSAQFYYDQQASASEVNIDEELVNLTKYQQAYQAAAEIISVTRSMMNTILDMV